jgi:hypothetical protein
MTVLRSAVGSSFTIATSESSVAIFTVTAARCPSRTNGDAADHMRLMLRRSARLAEAAAGTLGYMGAGELKSSPYLPFRSNSELLNRARREGLPI